ncbi:hypothetical protein MXB_3755 [Myxobolus squamalis]|nr:hypothetical protein MXB_3755 [Myxobolus squamalis]
MLVSTFWGNKRKMCIILLSPICKWHLNGNEHTRRRLAVYCVKDSYLPIRLLDKLMIITNYIEMSRVTGVPINCLLTRGQQVKVISQLLRSSKLENFILPHVSSLSGDEFEGATVIEPLKGYYDVPIATLDFVSLYPSIMITYNLCYTTLLTPTQAGQMDPEDYTHTPCGSYFVKKHIRPGILPSILQNLLDARKNAKQLLRIEKDPMKRKVYDGRQLAIKLSANSVYGFTGAQAGRLPCLEISGSTTAFGRSMIEQTKDFVESKYCRVNGYPNDSTVIYGDTDSVMIKFGTPSIEKSMEYAKEAAEYISTQFPSPIKLEFEKIYFPYLLVSKKRYAGLLYTKPASYDRIDCKGIETVRRDNCLLVANLISSCLYKILIERDPKAAIKSACQTISDLLMNKIDISLLIITKELRKTGEEYSNKQPHSELAERMRKRDPGSAPKLGDRVPYVYIMGSKKDRAYERAEDPIYVLDHNIPLDTSYYLENQLAKPLTRLFEPILGEKTKDTLLKGEHTLNRSISTSSAGLLTKYTKKNISCIACKSTIDTKNLIKPTLTSALCNYCEPKLKHFYTREITQLNFYQRRCSQLWTECQRCQGSYVDEVICTK